MKKLLLCVALGWVGAQANAAQWLTDLSKALDQAKVERKLVLVEFTGSDWCPPCMALHKEVLTSPEFEKYADKNLVLVEADFPNAKKQTEELKQSNKALQEKYAVEGFPTVIVLDGDGKMLSKTTGYEGAAPKAFIGNLEQLKKHKTSVNYSP